MNRPARDPARLGPDWRRRLRTAVRVARAIVAAAGALLALVAYALLAALTALPFSALGALVAIIAGAAVGLWLARPLVVGLILRHGAARVVGGGALWWLIPLVRRLLR